MTKQSIENLVNLINKRVDIIETCFNENNATQLSIEYAYLLGIVNCLRALNISLETISNSIHDCR